MVNEVDEDDSSAKSILFGSILIIFCNFLYIGNNYIVAWAKLKAPEVMLVRGGLQLLVFGFVNFYNKKEKNNIITKHGNRLRLFILLSILGFSTATAIWAVLSAIPLMPVGDVIVICYTAPVFSAV